MELWSGSAAAVAHLIVALSALFGGSVGWAIVTVSLAVRLALLPWSIRLARRAVARREVMARLEPELARLKARHAEDPLRLAKETRALLAKNGVALADLGVLLPTLAQLPLLALLDAAIVGAARAGARFLWIADLTRPDALLVALAAGLGGTLAVLAPGAKPQLATFLVPALITAVVLFRLSSAIGIYSVVSTAVALIPPALARRRR